MKRKNEQYKKKRYRIRYRKKKKDVQEVIER